MSCKPAVLIVAAAALACVGAARAQPLDLRLPDRGPGIPAAPLGRIGNQAPRAVPDLADPLDPLAPTRRPVSPVESAVFAKTAVEHHFAQRGDVTGAFGLLCGLKPGHGDGGASGAYGVDPHGRFVGAKFSIAFR